MKLPANVSNAIKRLNPSLFGPVSGLPDTKRQHNERSGAQDRQLEEGQESLGYCVTIISLRGRLLDAHDNIRTGAKPLVDQIAEFLGFRDDSNPKLEWNYEQLKSRTRGTVVVIEPIWRHQTTHTRTK